MISMGLEIIGENKNPMISTVAVTMDFRGGRGCKNSQRFRKKCKFR
jgi:hypothetical protein